MVKIVRVNILLEVSLLLSHLAFPRIGHIQVVYHIFGYLKQVQKRKLYFNPVLSLIREDCFHKFYWEEFYRDTKKTIHDDMPNPGGNIMTTHCLVNANHAADKVTRRSQTRILIFFNQAPIIWFSKR